MSGLGAVKESNGTFLVISGGYIWNKKADKNDPNYATQEWKDNEGEVKERSGARYGDLTGTITNTYFKTHPQYGEALYVTVNAGGEDYILNIKTNTANSQQMMKALLLANLDEEIFISPYDFVDKTSNKRVQGISFKQDGEKLDLKEFNLPDEWKTEKEFWVPSNKKKYTRFLEDFSDWLVSEIEEKVAPLLSKKDPVATKVDNVEEVSENVVEEQIEETVEKKKAPVKEVAKITPLKMKKFLKEYIEENYEDKELPKLSKDELKVWYDLAQETEELPFDNDSEVVEEVSNDAEVDSDDIQAQLDALAGM